MNEIIEALLNQVRAKAEEDISVEAREVLKTVELELTEMAKEVWTLDRIEELNEKTDSMSRRLRELKENQCSTEKK